MIRDDAVKVYPEIARSDTLLYVSRIKYGGYDTVMKTMLERAIPVQQSFIRLVDGETHHIPVSYTHLDVYKRQDCSFPAGTAAGGSHPTGDAWLLCQIKKIWHEENKNVLIYLDVSSILFPVGISGGVCHREQ